VKKERKKRKIIEEKKAEREKNMHCNATRQKRFSQCREKRINIEINAFELKGNLKLEGKTFEQRVVKRNRLNRIKRNTIIELRIGVNFVADKM